MRSSRDETEKHRQEIIDAAARLFREHGVDGVSVPALMESIGMTHGGFYKHFASKDELVPVAYQRAFDGIVESLSDMTGDDNDVAAWNAMASNYLSTAHRDNIGAGCPATAFAGDAARLGAGNPARAAYETGVDRMLDIIRSVKGGPDARQESLAALSTLIGALLLSRATEGELSEEVLAAARVHLLKNPAS